MDIAQFKLLYPELAQTNDVLIQQALDESGMVVLAGKWGVKLELAQGLYAAHLLTLKKNPAVAAGQSIRTATRKKTDDVEVQYATSSGEQAWYDLSYYGQRYWALLQTLTTGIGIFVV